MRARRSPWKVSLAAAMLLLAACGEKRDAAPAPSREPISVRGWIAEVEQPESNVFRTVETESARRTATFQGTTLWIDHVDYVSGGIAETGSFILLDVPPGNVAITFSAPPSVPQAKLTLENIPGNADVFVPGMILKKDGTVTVADPKAIQVRLAAQIDKPRPTKLVAKVAGNPVTVMEVPINAMVDRRDYPAAPSTGAPLAKVR
jgi:hypothetical protein